MRGTSVYFWTGFPVRHSKAGAEDESVPGDKIGFGQTVLETGVHLRNIRDVILIILNMQV